MPEYSKITDSLLRFAPTMKGVFSTADLFNVIGGGSSVANSRVIARLEKEGLITRCQRGFYVTRDYDIWTLGARIRERGKGYISMDSVLAANVLIGTVPRNLSMVIPGRNKTLRVQDRRIFFYHISSDFFFGFTNQNGICVADSEKAFLDLLYFYQQGRRFPIDPRNEVAVDRLNRKKITAYLKKYRNPKFISFVKGVLHG